MAEYIERKTVIEVIQDNCYHEDLVDEIKAIPAADVQPVKHGKWMYCSIEDMFHCTRCDAAAVRNSFVYCPICGAKMDGE